MQIDKVSTVHEQLTSKEWQINFSKTPFTTLARPTNRSVVARKLDMSLDGGWREDSLSRATRVGEFSRNALMERKMLTADKYIDCCCYPRSEYGEQTSSTMFAAFHLVIYLLSSFLQRSPMNSGRLSRQIAVRNVCPIGTC